MSKYPFPLFSKKILISAFLLRLKANYLENMRGSPYFSLWIPIALVKIYFFPRGPYLVQKPLYLGTVFKSVMRRNVLLKNYRDLYGDARWVLVRMGTNMAAGNQQKHLLLCSSTKA